MTDYNKIIRHAESDLRCSDLTSIQIAFANTVIKRATRAKEMSETDSISAWIFFTTGEVE